MQGLSFILQAFRDLSHGARVRFAENWSSAVGGGAAAGVAGRRLPPAVAGLSWVAADFHCLPIDPDVWT